MFSVSCAEQGCSAVPVYGRQPEPAMNPKFSNFSPDEPGQSLVCQRECRAFGHPSAFACDHRQRHNRPVLPYDLLEHRGRAMAVPALVAKTLSMAMAKGRSNINLRDNAKKARLRRRFERVADAWNAFQANRARDAVYEYLDAVFSIVMHYKVQRPAKRLLRHAFRFADLQFDQRDDPFTALVLRR